MRAALLGDAAIFRVGRAACDQIGHHNALIGHDDKEHVAAHHTRRKSPQMQQGGPAREHMGIEIRHRHKDDVQPDHQPRAVIAKPAFADQVIGDPAKGQRGQRDGHGLPRGQVHHGGVDQIKLGPHVINQHQHGKTRQPGGIAFPFEPGQMRGHRGRGDHVFLDVVKAAAMHLPFFARGTGRQVRHLLQPQIQRDEIKT